MLSLYCLITRELGPKLLLLLGIADTSVGKFKTIAFNGNLCSLTR